MSKVKLWIDPGHGLGNRQPGVYDPGACAGGLEEADIALTWALTGKHIARQLGIDVWLTRDDEGDPSYVGTRDDGAKAAGCTHGISLHCNASKNILVSGTETFYRGEANRLWAADINRIAVKHLGMRNRGIKTESLSQHKSLAVLAFPGRMALLEIGFITNALDRKRMLSRDARMAFWTEFLQGLR